MEQLEADLEFKSLSFEHTDLEEEIIYTLDKITKKNSRELDIFLCDGLKYTFIRAGLKGSRLKTYTKHLNNLKEDNIKSSHNLLKSYLVKLGYEYNQYLKKQLETNYL